MKDMYSCPIKRREREEEIATNVLAKADSVGIREEVVAQSRMDPKLNRTDP